MSFQLVPKSVTLNDLERRNGPYFLLFYRIFSERTTLRSLYAIAIPSVCRLSVRRLSVTLVRPTQPVEIFGIFSPYDSAGTLVF